MSTVILSFLFPFVITSWNNLLHLLPGRARATVVTAGVASSGVAGLMWMLTHDEITLSSGIAAALAIGGLALVVGSSAIVAFRAVPALVAALHDVRISSMTTREFLVHTFLRIPVVSGLAEEILFRGVMWWALAGLAGPMWAWWGTAVAFGIWHVVPAAQQARRRGAPVHRWVPLSVLVTFVAGIGFGWLRLVTGGVWAPAIVHAAINMVGSVGARMATDRRAITMSASPATVDAAH